ncbi:hypothetical protein O6H91_06G051100 [Diphasiastrum complanatum]|nr:hypothetical protein O6H91_06G051100 [Diphasiastrum complanatum]
MRRVSSCPLCKLPTSRREVRPAPHMDSLVIIYKDMKSAVVQSNASVPKKESRRISYPPKKRQKGEVFADLTNGFQFQNVAASKISKKECKIYDTSTEGDRIIRDIMPAKKRVQVPSLGSIEREICSFYDEPPEDGDAGMTRTHKFANENAKGCLENQKHQIAFQQCALDSTKTLDLNSMKNLSQNLGKSHFSQSHYKVDNRQSLKLNSEVSPQKRKLKHGRTSEGIPAVATQSVQKVENPCIEGHVYEQTLAPFFWLNEQNSQEDGTQLKETPLFETPLIKCPTFSDLKDSDDDNETLKDTDTFDWTQRPCSPELNCSPTHEKTSSMELSLSNNEKRNSKKVVINCAKGQASKLCINDIKEPIFNLQPPTRLHKYKGLAIRENIKDGTEGICREKSTSNENRKDSKTGQRTIRKNSCKEQDSKHTAFRMQGTDMQGSSAKNKKEKNLLSQSDRRKDSDLQAKNLTCDNVRQNIPTGADNEDERAELEAVAPSISQQPDQGVAEPCESDIHEPVCAFCQSSGDSEVAGSMMQYSNGVLVFMPVDAPPSTAVTVHKLCAEWAPEVYFTDDTVHNLTSEVTRSLKLKCSSCGGKGAALGCFLKRCPKSFHYPCARALRKCKWDEDNFIMLCPEHRSCKFPVELKDKVAVPKSKEPLRQVFSTSFRNNKENIKGFTGNAHHGQLPPSPQNHKWPLGPHQKWVLCGSALDSDGKAELASVAYFSGATIVKTYTPAVTHVITATDEDGAARRTLKFLMGALEGKWILKADWLSACLAAGNAVEEDSFEVHGDIHGVVEGPKRGRAFVAAQAPKLFEGLSFYFSGDFELAYKADLQSLIQAGGGTILQRKPVPFADTESHAKVSRKIKRGQKVFVFVIYNADPACTGSIEDKRSAVEVQYLEACSIAEASHASVLAHTWILDSAAGWKLQPFQ